MLRYLTEQGFLDAQQMSVAFQRRDSELFHKLYLT